VIIIIIIIRVLIFAVDKIYNNSIVILSRDCSDA